MRTLVVRMDDLGYSEGVNCGIAKAATGGIARTIGVMANMPWAESGINLLRETLAREGRSLDDLAIGVHANISNGVSLADSGSVPSLVDPATGEFLSSSFHRANPDHATAGDIRRELEAQYDRLRELIGRDPDFVDIHAVMAAEFATTVCSFAEERGVTCGADLGFTTEPLVVGMTTVHQVPMAPFDTGSVEALFELVTASLAAVPDGGTAVYIDHPGYVDEYLMTHSSLNLERIYEAALLTSPAFKAWLEENGYEPASFRAL